MHSCTRELILTVFAGWTDEAKGPSGGWGGEQPLTSPSWPGGPKPAKTPGWAEEMVDSAWGHPSIQRQQMPKQFPKELQQGNWSSKQFRFLSDMNFKVSRAEIIITFHILFNRFIFPERRSGERSANKYEPSRCIRSIKHWKDVRVVE